MMDKKINIGIWGLGRAGWNMHCQELDQFAGLYSVVAACEPIRERLDKFAERYPAARTYADGDAFLADPEMEVVAIAVRSKEHVDYTFRALKAGKMVFLEKPIALTYADALRLKQAAETTYRGQLYFRHNRRFETCFNHVLEIMRSGVLGEVYEIKLCRHNFQLRDDWQTLRSEGGGQLNNWGPHLIDHALRLLESPLKEVWSDLKRVAARGDAEDHIKVICKGENDRVVDVEISGGVLIPGPVYTVYGNRGTLVSWNEQEIQLKYLDPAQNFPDTHGSPGTPEWDSGYGTLEGLKWIEKTIPTAPANGADMSEIYASLYRTIREGAEYPITPAQAAEVVRVTEMVKNASKFR